MRPWFIKEGEVVPFAKKEKTVVSMPNVASYPSFLAGVEDLQSRVKQGTLSDEMYKRLYTDLLHRFMRRESAETPWFMAEAPQDNIPNDEKGIMSLAPAEKERVKNRVLKALQKKQAEDPIFDKIYKTIVGPALDTRIKNYIEQHKDADIGASEMQFLIKTIPQLGNTQEIKEFVTQWNKGANFISTEKLVPAAGMTGSAPIQNVIAEGIPKLLFQTLAKSYKEFTKSDAGPAEGALAIMSNRITYAEKGGDLIIDKNKIEVKSGGKGEGAGGGRIYNDRRNIDQSGMEAVLNKVGFNGNITVLAGTKPLPNNFPKKEFIQECSKAFFGKIMPNIVKSFGTPSFRMEWNNAIFDDYKNSAGHSGILIIGQTQYQYIVNGEQLLTVPQKNPGALYYPSSRQSRDLGIQIRLD